MTLAIAVATADGIAMAADSRTSIGKPHHRILSDTTSKLFEVDGHGIATFGVAVLGQRNIAAHVEGFAATYGSPSGDVDELADAIVAHFQPLVAAHYQALGKPLPTGASIGFLVAGYQGAVGKVLEIGLPAGTIAEQRRTDTAPGAVWRGQTDVLDRVLQGVDLQLLAALAVANGQEAAFQALTPSLQQLAYDTAPGYVNLQDAVDLAEMAVEITKDIQRVAVHAAGVPVVAGVGGVTQLLVLMQDKHEWLRRAELTPRA